MVAIVQVKPFEFHQRVAESRGTVLVCFTGSACGACRMLKRVVSEDHEHLRDIQIWEVDAERDLGFTREFEVFHLPAMFLFHHGRYHCPLHAEPVAAQLRAAIDSALARPAEEAP